MVPVIVWIITEMERRQIRKRSRSQTQGELKLRLMDLQEDTKFWRTLFMLWLLIHENCLWQWAVIQWRLVNLLDQELSHFSVKGQIISTLCLWAMRFLCQLLIYILYQYVNEWVCRVPIKNYLLKEGSELDLGLQFCETWSKSLCSPTSLAACMTTIYCPYIMQFMVQLGSLWKLRREGSKLEHQWPTTQPQLTDQKKTNF